MDSNNNKVYFNNNTNNNNNNYHHNNNYNNYNKNQNQNRNRRPNQNYYGNNNQQQNYYRPNYYTDNRYPKEAMMNPYYAQNIINRTQIYIYTKYRPLIDINVKNQGMSTSIDQSSFFYVIKSFSEEDVHKSIKYGVWSSSKNGNQTLSNSFKLAKEKNSSVYLFFSCNGSGRFIGMARMKTACDNDKSFDYWTQDGKWPGLFDVEWIFIKDVPFREFKKIVITMRDGETKSVSNSRDVQEVPFLQAKTMVEIFESYQNVNTILEHFEYYDARQENYEKTLNSQQEMIEGMQKDGVQVKGEGEGEGDGKDNEKGLDKNKDTEAQGQAIEAEENINPK